MSLVISKMKVSVALNKTKLNKSGNNKHMGFKYFKLDDFLPTLNDLMLKEEIGDMVTTEFNDKSQRYEICLYLFKGEEKQRYSMPFNEYETPLAKSGNKTMQDVQYIGALKSYYRRYLYVDAFGIADGEIVDEMDNNDVSKPQPNQHSSLGGLSEEEATNQATKLGLDKLIKSLEKPENVEFKPLVMKNICDILGVGSWYDIKFTGNLDYKKLTSLVLQQLETEKNMKEAGI